MGWPYRSMIKEVLSNVMKTKWIATMKKKGQFQKTTGRNRGWLGVGLSCRLIRKEVIVAIKNLAWKVLNIKIFYKRDKSKDEIPGLGEI